MARHELADHVATILKRAYPGEVTKDELEDQAGVGSQDLRAALDSLSEEGELDPIAEHFRWRDPTGEDKPPPDPSPEDEAEPSAEAAPAATATGGPSAKLELKVAIGFPVANPDDASGIEEQSQRIIEQIQSLVRSALPGMGAAVSAKRLEVYGEPRVLFDAAEEVSEKAEPAAVDDQQ